MKRKYHGSRSFPAGKIGDPPDVRLKKIPMPRIWWSLIFLVSFALRCQCKSRGPDRVAALGPSPPPEAIRVLPQRDREVPQITPYLLYQTGLAWHQGELRRVCWSQVKTEDDLPGLRAELRKSVLEMIGGLPTEKTDFHATITGQM